MELELLTQEEADKNPVGAAHEEPEAIPKPKWMKFLICQAIILVTIYLLIYLFDYSLFHNLDLVTV